MSIAREDSLRPHARFSLYGFPRGSTLPDPNKVLEGDGKALRHIKLRSLRDVERPLVRRYIRAAIEQLPGQRRGTGKTVVKARGQSRKPKGKRQMLRD